MEKKIITKYWYSILKDLPYGHNEEFDCDMENRISIVNTILQAGYNVLIENTSFGIIIWIDDKRFGIR